jgi:hypothetical protein
VSWENECRLAPGLLPRKRDLAGPRQFLDAKSLHQVEEFANLAFVTGDFDG